MFLYLFSASKKLLHSLITCLFLLVLSVTVNAEESPEMVDKESMMLDDKAMAEQSMSDSKMKDKGMMDNAMSDNTMSDKNMSDKSMADKGKADKRNIKHPTDVYQQYKDDLARFTTTDEMLAGTESITTLFSPSKSANNKGVVILFPDWQKSAITPNSLSFLHNTMPDHGWATITIQPLNKPENYPSNALEAATRAEENAETFTTYQEQLSAIYLAVMEKATSMPGLVLFISEGNNAGVLTRIANKANTLRPNAMVLLSAYHSTETEDFDFAKQMAMSDIPVLDLYLKQDNPQVTPSALNRKKQAAIDLKIVYRQKQLNNFTPSYYPKEQLLKEIQGWLKVIGW